MYVATRVETFGVHAHAFTCKHCGFRGEAHVVMTGVSEVPFAGPDAAEVGAVGARMDADRMERRSLMFAPCPECGKVDPAGAGYKRVRMAGVIAIAVGLIALGVVVSRTMTSPVSLLAIAMPGGFGIVTAVKAYFHVRRPWHRAAYRVMFDGYPGPDG